MKKQDTLVKLEDDKYYILASSSYADDRVMLLNYEDTFAVFDRWGDIRQFGTGLQGIYHQGTRFISEMELELNHYRPMLLSANIKNENEILSVDLTNPDIDVSSNNSSGMIIPKGTIHISRSKFLQNGACHELITLENYGSGVYETELTLTFYADFRDIFEVRGMERKQRGELHDPVMPSPNTIELSYEGLDSIIRKTSIQFEPVPFLLERNTAVYKIVLHPKEIHTISCIAIFQTQTSSASFETYSSAYSRMTSALQKSRGIVANIYTDNEQFNHWINRSQNDFISLLTQTTQGYYPYAGVPWYNTVFGRDGIITALESLWMAPEIARGVLRFLASRQATTSDALKDAEPGKILHEMRYGEMAETGEIPFKLYYGSIDTTPLFIVLAGQYLKRTNDLETITDIWSNIINAVDWIDNYGDMDGDGFVEYERKAESGLSNQGWKDSHDSISHANGELASFPIALSEVQGYAYDAKIQASYLAGRLGKLKLSERWENEAAVLKERFNEVFWNEDLGTYVLALDGDKKPCTVVASNAGHCLYSGIATPERAAKTAKVLMNQEMFNGWGIRTLSTKEVRYNPMSYHNGSVWPHDTALIASGFARYGIMNDTMRLMQGLFDASLFIHLQRLPELFCGFPFRAGEAPTAYPVACSPQAWSVASVFILMQSCLQISIDAEQKKLILCKPRLPDYINEVKISNLRAGDDSFELEIFKYQYDLGIHVIKKPADWEVISVR